MNKARFAPFFSRPWLVGIAVFVAFLFLVIAFFPWDTLREPINRYVSAQLGRNFEITRHLSVSVGRTTTVRAEAVEVANPSWAQEPYLLKATAAEFDIRLLPLLFGKVEIPRIVLTEPRIGLQLEPDGRRTWALSSDTSDASSAPNIGELLVDKGSLSYRAAAQGADLDVQFSLASESGDELPLSYKVAGKWQREKFTASGRTGGILKLSEDSSGQFPLEVDAVAGNTTLKAKGSISNLAALGAMDVRFDLQGRNLDELYKFLGVALPSTRPYKVSGQLVKRGQLWSATGITGVLGKSDITGALNFDQSTKVPLLSGKVQSKVLDFADLGPVVGLAPSAMTPEKATAGAASGGRAQSASRKVLPVATLDVARLQSMDADVVYSAADIKHVEALPLDKGSVHVKLKAGVLQLEPLSLGVAGGTVAGSIQIDSNATPASYVARLDVRALRFNQLFPTVETTKTGLGKISGQFDLKGKGNSAAQMLGSASGNMAVLMGQGEISNILLEFMGLDGGEVIKFLLRGDRNVQLRCGAAAFDVKQGLMTSRAIVLDTADTLITGEGRISLADETLDILLKPEPKDRSILSLRSPLKIGGTFGKPSAAPDKAALAGRAGLALLLGAINPLLALAATIETGPGENADCAGVLAVAATPNAVAKPKAEVKPKADLPRAPVIRH